MFQKLRELSKNLAIYGVGDVAVQIVSFLLVPLYVRFLTPADYGVLGLLGGVEAGAKLFFRWGLDGAFMRFWYDCEDAPASAEAVASARRNGANRLAWERRAGAEIDIVARTVTKRAGDPNPWREDSRRRAEPREPVRRRKRRPPVPHRSLDASR